MNLSYYNKLFVLSFENKDDRGVHRGNFFPKVEINDCNVMIDGRNFFDQQIKNNQLTYDRLWYIQKIAAGQGDDYTTDCFLVFCNRFKFDVDRKAIQQTNFTGNLERDGNGSFNIMLI